MKKHKGQKGSDMKCIVCNKSNSISFYTTSVRDNVEYLKCSDCKIYFPKKIPEQLNEIYEEHVSEQESSMLLDIVESLRAQQIRKYIRRGKIMDVGCGNGFFLEQFLKDKAFKLYALEPSPECSRTAKKRLKSAKIFTDFYQNLKLKEKMDVMTAYHVLEHLPDPVDFIGFCSRNIRKGGALVLELPNIESFDSRTQKSSWWMLGGEHIFLPSKRFLKKTLEQNGFRVVETSSVGLFFKPKFKPAVRTNSATVKNKKLVKKNEESPFTKSVLKAFYRVYLFMIKKSNMGESMRIVAIKK